MTQSASLAEQMGLIIISRVMGFRSLQVDLKHYHDFFRTNNTLYFDPDRYSLKTFFELITATPPKIALIKTYAPVLNSENVTLLPSP